MTILITGATGFLGSHLLEGLLHSNYELLATRRTLSDMKRVAQFVNHVRVTWYNTDEISWENIFTRHEIDGIIHTATEYGRNKEVSDIYTSNIIFPLRLCETAIMHRIGFFINTDSYFTKFPHYRYLNNYITSKEIFLSALKQFAGRLKIINVKLEHVFGPDDSENKFVTMLIRKLLNNEVSIDLSEGNQMRDFVYVSDVVSAYQIILQKIKHISTDTEFEVGQGRSITIKEFAKMAKHESGASTELLFGKISARQPEIESSKADLTNLSSLGWACQYSTTEAIKKTIAIERKLYAAKGIQTQS